ncbi:MBL fold metallo-hydrolase [Sungkyunkwania multivorans]|uniref:MBL fold metallo-hydrolase n=1 Tax=Sungkyunkwania multivorans TaxID=1173618 RepID=A0ABW3D021_9FLAO
MRILVLLSIAFLLTACGEMNTDKIEKSDTNTSQFIQVLGISQDAGFPQIACKRDCCKKAFENTSVGEMVTSIGIVDLNFTQKFLVEATPDISYQLQHLNESAGNEKTIDGIFITHAHIGHYTGLMYLGRESLGANNIPVYAMPRMRSFLENNGPWSQLISLENITLENLEKDSPVALNAHLRITPFLVPHRDEFSETVGFKITGKSKSALFIPDIDKWEKWKNDIVEEVKKVDYALLDATFFKNGEIPRDMSEVPHPFVEETVARFKGTSKETKQKIIFVHFNHSNPALNPEDPLRQELEAVGYRFAFQGMRLPLD